MTPEEALRTVSKLLPALFDILQEGDSWASNILLLISLKEHDRQVSLGLIHLIAAKFEQLSVLKCLDPVCSRPLQRRQY